MTNGPDGNSEFCFQKRKKKNFVIIHATHKSFSVPDGATFCSALSLTFCGMKLGISYSDLEITVVQVRAECNRSRRNIASCVSGLPAAE